MNRDNCRSDLPKTISICILFFFLLIVWVPSGYNIWKIVFLMPVLAYAVIRIIQRQGVMQFPRSVQLLLLMVFSNLGFCVYGALVNNPGAIRVATIEVVWPILYLIVFQIFPKKNDVQKMLSAFVLVGDLLAIYDLVYTISNVVGKYAVVRPIYEIVDTGIHYGYNQSTGIFSFNSDHGMFFVFFTPIVITLTYLKFFLHDEKLSFINSKFLSYSCILLIAANFLSGKRAIQLSVIITIMMLILFTAKKRIFIPHNMLMVIMLLVIISIVLLCLNFEKVSNWFLYAVNNIIEGFRWGNKDVNSSEYARGTQANALIGGWLEKPLFGSGAGAYVKDYYRVEDKIWSYELSYHALLFQKGIVGFCIFGMVAFYTMKSLYRRSKLDNVRWITLPLLMGYICFLCGNAFNPFFGRSSMLWIYYMPLLLSDSDAIAEQNPNYI